jgi:hypothetical protein
MIAKLIIFLCALSFSCMAQTAPGPKPPLSAPKDAKLFNWKWYAVITDKVSWHVAKDKCARMGGQLAVVPDAKTWEFIKGLTKTKVWLGATDEKVEGEWVWVDGTKVTFTSWVAGNPSNTNGSENYLTTAPKYGGNWNDWPKDWDAAKDAPVVGYICEWQAR